jgi:hypothetical protein
VQAERLSFLTPTQLVTHGLWVHLEGISGGDQTCISAQNEQDPPCPVWTVPSKLLQA